MLIIHLSVIHKNTVFQPKSPEWPCGRVAVPRHARSSTLALTTFPTLLNTLHVYEPTRVQEALRAGAYSLPEDMSAHMAPHEQTCMTHLLLT